MKKFLKIFFAIIFAFSLIANTFAEETNNENGNTSEKTKSLILVSEKPLGAKNCYCAKANPNAKQGATLDERYERVGTSVGGTCGSDVQIHERLYVCEEATLGEMIQGIVVWIIRIALLLGVLAVAALGIAWGVAGGDDPEYKKNLKDWLV